VGVGGSGVAVAVEFGVADGVGVAVGVLVDARVGTRVAVWVAVAGGGNGVAVGGTTAGPGVGVEPQPARKIASAAPMRNVPSLQVRVADEDETRCFNLR